jgi:hypothetical protein
MAHLYLDRSTYATYVYTDQISLASDLAGRKLYTLTSAANGDILCPWNMQTQSHHNLGDYDGISSSAQVCRKLTSTAHANNSR